MGKECDANRVAEIFHVQLNSTGYDTFLNESDAIHHYFETCEGYIGMEVMMLSETTFMILIRWANGRAFNRNVSAMLNTPEVSYWLRNCSDISHQPALTFIYNNR